MDRPSKFDTSPSRGSIAAEGRESRFETLIASIDEGYCLCEMLLDADGRPVDYRFLEANAQFEPLTGLTDVVGRTALQLVPDLEPRWVELYARAAIDRESFRFEEKSDALGRIFDVFTAPVDPPGRFIVLFRDVTEKARQDEQIRMLMRELTHRTKNILAVVQAVARQTAAGDPATFVDRFSDRIAALAASHDLLTVESWAGVEIDALVRAQLAHFADLLETRIHATGPPVRLGPSVASALGMALHELATNAAKYGALSGAAGGVSITWELADGRFRMSWVERGGPPVASPATKGFGSVVVKRLTETSLGAQVRLDYDPAGLVWELHCPEDHLKARDVP